MLLQQKQCTLFSCESPQSAKASCSRYKHAPAISTESTLIAHTKARDTEVLTIAPQHAYKIKKDDTLTKLLFGSGPVPECGNLYAYLVGGVENDHAGYTEVWCIYRVVSGSAASAWLLIALGIAVVIGFGVGVGVGDGKLGLDIGTGVFAVFTGIHLAIVLGMVY